MIIALILFLIKLLILLIVIAAAFLIYRRIHVNLVKGICNCTVRIDDKVVLVTGGNAGIGFETAKRLARHGARVLIASRNLHKSQTAAQNISEATGNPNIEAKSLDLSSFANVKQFAEDFNKSYDRLDILINNAGYSEMDQVFTDDGIEKIMHVNHFGPAYLTHLLLDKLKASKSARIVFVSSSMYKFHKFNPNDIIGETPQNLWVRYANSKLCNILSAIALAQRLPEGVTANALHPGSTASEIWERIPWEQARKFAYFILRLVCKTVEECAQGSIHAALAPSLENVSGKFLQECKLKALEKVPPPAELQEMALKAWDDTIRIAEGALEAVFKPAVLGEAPWYTHLRVAVRHTGEMRTCASSLIHTHWLLTAARCIRYNRYIWVSFGVDLYRPTLLAETNTLRVFPQHNHTDIHDISIVNLTRHTIHVPNDYYAHPLIVTSERTPLPSIAKLCSYGRQQNGAPGVSLGCIELRVSPREDGFIVGEADEGWTTEYDIGAPLVADGVQFGILLRVGNNEKVGLFLHPAFYRDWMKTVMLEDLPTPENSSEGGEIERDSIIPDVQMFSDNESVINY